MKLTNKLNLPEPFVKFAEDSSKTHEFNPLSFSVTELLCSVREIVLKREHYNELETDVSDSIPALFGTAVHKIMEENGKENETEVKLEMKLGKFTVKGICDSLKLDEQLVEDYKTCSTSKIMKQDFEDWRKQGLAYALMAFKKYDVKITKLKFYALMKDWSKVKSAMSANYPSSPIYIYEYDIQDSDYDYIYNYLKNKLNDIDNYFDDECSEEDRWYTGTKYAVYKNESDKKATIICDSEEEANGYIEHKLNGNGIVQVRIGENLKCKYYCTVCKFCGKGN